MTIRGIARNALTKFWKAGLTLRLVALNRLSRKPVTGSHGPVVSLTSYGTRARSVYLAIESIARGDVLPSRLILWLDDPDLLRRPPRPLQRLARRGLEIRPCANLGPHKKYYPYLQETPRPTVPLVTADDDVIYPIHWLARLAARAEQYPEAVVCYRARQIQVAESSANPSLISYSDWPLCRSDQPGAHIFPTGTSGVLYPVGLQHVLREAGNGAATPLRFVDDVWLHSRSIAAGYTARQVDPEAIHFPMLFRSQTNALFRRNVDDQENDGHVQRTYGPELAALIATSEAAGARGGADG